MGLFQKVMTRTLCQNVNFENGGTGTTIHVSVLHVLNIFTAKGTWHVCQFRDAKRVVMSFYVLRKNNKMQVAGLVRTFG